MSICSLTTPSSTAAFRALLPPHYHFTFIDGGVSCAPSPGVENLYSGPYKCFYESPSTERVAAAHLALETAVKTKGPFQLVMGFSQVRLHRTKPVVLRQLYRREQP